MTRPCPCRFVCERPTACPRVEHPPAPAAAAGVPVWTVILLDAVFGFMAGLRR